MSEFDEWFKNRHTKTGLYEEALCGKDNATYIRHEMRKAYKAGQKSQQAKIDLLEKELTETQAFLNKQNHIKQAKIDELQARIDEALNTLCKLQYSSGERIYNDVGNILKGNKDEN